jgi:hypothetical protein
MDKWPDRILLAVGPFIQIKLNGLVSSAMKTYYRSYVVELAYV